MIEQFREFVVLADSLNFSRAAEQLFTTQPTLSRHISKLEEELGAPLFHRTTTSVELTSFGREILPRVRDMLEIYDSILESSPTHTIAGTLRIGGFVHQPAIADMLKRTVGVFQSKHPSVRFSIADTAHVYPDAYLINGEFDVMLSPLPSALDSRHIAYRPLLELPIRAWISDKSSIASQSRTSLAQLSPLKYVFWAQEDEDPLVSRFKALFTERNLNIRVGSQFIANYHDTLAEDEYLLTIDFPPEANPTIKNVRMIALEDAERITICAAYLKKNERTAAGLFAREVQTLANALATAPA